MITSAKSGNVAPGWEDGVGKKDGWEGVYLVATNVDVSSGRVSSAQSPIARTSLPGVAAS